MARPFAARNAQPKLAEDVAPASVSRRPISEVDGWSFPEREPGACVVSLTHVLDRAGHTISKPGGGCLARDGRSTNGAGAPRPIETRPRVHQKLCVLMRISLDALRRFARCRISSASRKRLSAHLVRLHEAIATLARVRRPLTADRCSKAILALQKLRCYTGFMNIELVPHADLSDESCSSKSCGSRRRSERRRLN